MSAQESATVAGQDSDLRRSLSRRQMVLLGLGSALGTGLFLGAGQSIAVAGPAVILSFAAGAVIAGIVAFALGEMSSVHPERGSFGAISARYLGAWAGMGQRWTYWFALMGGIGSEVVAGALYLQYWWPRIPLWLAVVVLAALLAVVNLRAVRSFGSVEAVLSTVKVIAIVVFLCLGLVLIVFGLPAHRATGVTNWTAIGGFFPHGGLAVWLVMATVIFSFTGVELVAIGSAEAIDPARSMRVAVRSLIFRLGVFYIGAIAVIVAVLPWPRVAQASGVQQSPFVTLFTAVGIPAAATITNALVLIAALSAANANLYAAARTVHSLAHDGFAPRRLAKTNAQGAPVAAVLWSLVGLVVATVLAGYTPDTVFPILISLASFGVIAVWITVLVTLIAFRRGPNARLATLRLPGGNVTAIVGIAALFSVYCTGFFVSDMALACAVGVPFLVVLALAYLLVRRRARSTG